ncbi:UNVERIFIED_ORG: hypothetical protein E4P37_09700 [Bacillus sp. AZ43]
MSTTSRAGRLLAGLALYGLSIGLLVEADLGLDPWDVLHQGLSLRTGLSLGTVVVATSVLVLLAWIPLRQRPGAGTLANALLVGVFLDVSLAILPSPTELPWRCAMLVGGIVLNAVATGLYLAAGMGAGARDGLMTGLAARGMPIRRARTAIEVVVLAVGYLLGGTVGIGTVLYAASIGPLAHLFIPFFAGRSRPAVGSPIRGEAQ